MNKPYMLDVFINDKGEYGNPASLILDENRELDAAKRLQITKDIGHDETVFVNNLTNGDVSIYHAYGEINFAGNVMVGAAWQLSKLKDQTTFTVHCQDLDIAARINGDTAWIQASEAQYMRSWEIQQLGSSEEIERINVADTAGWKARLVWAWINEKDGTVRARTFASDKGIPEVLGNGSGSMMLAARLNRSLRITHGEGCVIYARPIANGLIELGGRVRVLV
jgi:predicted PhzF superfamily epimerase YddE/YHI9